MSRTFRRKNYEKTRGGSWANRYSKTAGYYTFVDGYWDWDAGIRIYEYREPTEREFYKKYWTIHGDDRCFNENEPRKWLRKHKMSQNRTRNKREFDLWLKRQDEYEPIFESKPRLHPWEMCWD